MMFMIDCSVISGVPHGSLRMVRDKRMADSQVVYIQGEHILRQDEQLMLMCRPQSGGRAA